MTRHNKLPKLSTVVVIVGLFYWCITLVCAQSSSAGGTSFPNRRELAEIHRHLARINKPAVKSIQSDDGDIIDCVHRALQPAFDHPALRNHSLELTSPPIPRSSGASEGEDVAAGVLADDLPPPQLWHQSGRCPEGTIAIRRTSVSDVLRAGGLKQYMTKSPSGLSTAIPQPLALRILQSNSSYLRHEHSVGYMYGDTMHGAQATLNVWKPSVQAYTEFSLTQIWVTAGTFGVDQNTAEAGWQVYGQLYGDNKPRLFIYWTADAYQDTGCYNLLCSGFVQTSNSVAIGSSITPISTIGGSQYDIRILIWKDPSKGNWWLKVGENHTVGYWPASIFTNLARNSSLLEWGGEVINRKLNGNHTTTKMGSGQFAEKGFAQASYVRNIKYVDKNNVLQNASGMQVLATQPKCYSVKKGQNTTTSWGTHFYYGGPGLNANCT